AGRPPRPAAADPLLAAAESAGALPLVAARTWSSLWANRAAALAAAAAAPQTAAPIRPAVAGGSDEPLAALLVEVLDRCGDEDGIIALFHLREVLPAACGPLADRFERRGRLEEAIAAARTAAALAAPAQRPTWRERLAELLSAAGRPAQAVAYLLANLEETPDAGTFQRLHRAASAAGQWDTVRHRACAALAGVPLTEEAAAALVAAGAVREAAEALLRDGPAPPPRSALAVAHALRPDDPDLAFRVALHTLAAILASAPAPPPGTLDLARLVAALADQLDAARAAATAAEAPATQALATALNQLKERLEGAALPDRRPWQPILTVLHACRFPALDVEGWHGKRAP
ncbi:MAG: hypothetical protein IRY95_01260, partial [Clostridia bacterium]|nr:hypothetical protein [Clostridia bacterium]